MRIDCSKIARISMHVIALVLITVLAASITFSWVENGKPRNISAEGIIVSSGNDLILRQDGKIINSIVIPPSCKLHEVSSADGKNYFFPTTDNKSNLTAAMTFREGVPEDKNSGYLCIDFQLEAGDSDAVVYLGADTAVQCSSQDVSEALRVAFSKNDGSNPIIFKPGQVSGISDTAFYYPISSISADGIPTTTAVTTDAFGDYCFSENDNKPVFSISEGETLNLTLSIWLEGTAFTGNSIENAEINVYIDFITKDAN